MRFSVFSATIGLLFTLMIDESLQINNFFPVKLHPDEGIIRRRDLYKHHQLLTPQSSVQLLYAEGGGDKDHVTSTIPYVINVTATHNSRSYVLVEDFEGMLADISCLKDPKDKRNTLLKLKFQNERLLGYATRHWGNKRDLAFVTHHTTCNEDAERGVYVSSSIAFDAQNMLVTIKGRHERLGSSRHASSLMKITGGMPSKHLTKRITRRVANPLNKRAAGSPSLLYDLDFHWDQRELFYQWGGMRIDCVDCSMTGKIEAAFSYDIDTDAGDVIRRAGEFVTTAASDAVNCAAKVATGSGCEKDLSISPQKMVSTVIKKAIVTISVSETIKGRFGFDIAAAASISVTTSFPPSATFGVSAGDPNMPGSNKQGSAEGAESRESDPNAIEEDSDEPAKSDSNVGATFEPPVGGDSTFEIGDWKFGFSKQMGITLGTILEGYIRLIFPLTVDIPSNQQIVLDPLGDTSSSTFEPQVDMKQPRVQIDANIDIWLAIGPYLKISIDNKALDFKLTTSATLDIPRWDWIAKIVHNVDENCEKGSFVNAWSFKRTLGYGPRFDFKAYTRHWGSQLPSSIGRKFWKERLLQEFCINMPGLPFKGPGRDSGVGAPSLSYAPPGLAPSKPGDPPPMMVASVGGGNSLGEGFALNSDRGGAIAKPPTASVVNFPQDGGGTRPSPNPPPPPPEAFKSPSAGSISTPAVENYPPVPSSGAVAANSPSKPADAFVSPPAGSNPTAGPVGDFPFTTGDSPAQHMPSPDSTNQGAAPIAAAQVMAQALPPNPPPQGASLVMAGNPTTTPANVLDQPPSAVSPDASLKNPPPKSVPPAESLPDSPSLQLAQAVQGGEAGPFPGLASARRSRPRRRRRSFRASYPLPGKW
ncbi:MAG: hypothetical protein M1829_003587 [Trizodia sp. TS-e1964]|nr:MAG: hypothetical protein M1829_003587 [Trizodia sp. TS-e1964]